MALLTNINGKFSVSDAGAVTFNNAFTFPTTDGTANYVLKTNGNGVLDWAPDANTDAVTKIIGGTNITVSPATGIGDVTVNADLAGTVTGSGTLNKVPRWTATGSNLGDGPITFATNDSTFAGIVTTDKIFVAKGQNLAHVASSIIISQETTTKSQIRFYGADASTAGILEFTGSSSDGAVGGVRLTINADGSSNFTGSVTGVRLFSASGGNKTNPMIAVATDQDTGIFFPSANVMAFTAGDTEALRFTGANSTFAGNVSFPNSDLSSTAPPTNFGVYTSEIRLIETPNGGLKQCRVITDNYGEWILVGRFAASAMTTVQGVWSSESGLDTSTSQSTTTKFSADFGDSYPTEVRIMGATDFTKWRDTRTVDFIYGVPEGRQWKFFFSGGVENGMAQSTKYGWGINGAYDGFGRWVNPAQNFVRMSDTTTAILNPSAAYTTATANAFNWNTNLDAKITVSATRVFSGQDTFVTSGFGADDYNPGVSGAQGFFDEYPNETNNMQGGTDFSSSVWVLIKLPNASSGGGGGGDTFWSESGTDIHNTNSGNVGIGVTSPGALLQVGETPTSSSQQGAHIYGYDGALSLYTTRQGESPFNAALYLYNNPAAGTGTGTGILFRAKTGGGGGTEFTQGRIQGAVYTSWTTNTDATRTSKMGFRTTDSAVTNDKMTILGNGNVGIGTDQPKHLLHIKSTISGPTGIIIENTNNAQSLDIDFYNNADAAQGRIRYNEGAGSFDFLPNVSAGQALTILYGGNVGINNTAPAKKLEISSPTNADGILLTGDGTGGGMATGNYRSIGFSYTDTDTSYGSEMKFEIPDSANHGGQISFWTDEITGTGNSIRAMTIDRSQNVGIGIQGPSYRLDVRGDSGIYTNLTVGYQPVTSSTTNYEHKLRVRGKNNFSDGTNWYGTYGQILLHADTNMTGSAKRFLITNALDNNKFAIVRSVDGNTDPVVNSTAAGVNSGTADFVINNGGNIGIGQPSPSYKLHVVGTGTQAAFQTTASYSDILLQNSTATNFINFSGATFIVYQGGGSGSNVTFAVDSGGTATFKADVVAYGSPSDKRLKENIKTIDSALEKVMKLKGVTFDWKDKEDILDKEGKPIKIKKWKHDVGFIAQDVQKVIPELVRENDNGMLSMRHQGIAPILLEAIKELKAEIEKLKSNKCNCK